MTEQDPKPPVRPDVWGDRPLPPPGQPLDLSQDPDRVQPLVLPPPGRPLDLSQDPDRYVPDAPVGRPGQPLDLLQDPDRVRPGDRTLTELLGDGAQEEPRDSYVWLLGLLAVLVFLGLVAFIAGNLGPG